MKRRNPLEPVSFHLLFDEPDRAGVFRAFDHGNMLDALHAAQEGGGIGEQVGEKLVECALESAIHQFIFDQPLHLFGGVGGAFVAVLDHQLTDIAGIFVGVVRRHLQSHRGNTLHFRHRGLHDLLHEGIGEVGIGSRFNGPGLFRTSEDFSDPCRAGCAFDLGDGVVGV